jgi:hypothetical protein
MEKIKSGDLLVASYSYSNPSEVYRAIKDFDLCTVLTGRNPFKDNHGAYLEKIGYVEKVKWIELDLDSTYYGGDDL